MHCPVVEFAPCSSVFTPTTYSTHSDDCAALGESSFDLVTPGLADSVTPGSVKCVVCKWGGVQCPVVEFVPRHAGEPLLSGQYSSGGCTVLYSTDHQVAAVIWAVCCVYSTMQCAMCV